MCFCIKFNVATVNTNIFMFKWFPKNKKRTEMLYFLTEHTLTVYKREASSLKEKSLEKDSEHFVSDSIFKI